MAILAGDGIRLRVSSAGSGRVLPSPCEPRSLDCGHGQGFLFSAALDADSVAELLEADPRW
jgi:hypothetical protein